MAVDTDSPTGVAPQETGTIISGADRRAVACEVVGGGVDPGGRWHAAFDVGRDNHFREQLRAGIRGRAAR